VWCGKRAVRQAQGRRHDRYMAGYPATVLYTAATVRRFGTAAALNSTAERMRCQSAGSTSERGGETGCGNATPAAATAALRRHGRCGEERGVYSMSSGRRLRTRTGGEVRQVRRRYDVRSDKIRREAVSIPPPEWHACRSPAQPRPPAYNARPAERTSRRSMNAYNARTPAEERR